MPSPLLRPKTVAILLAAVTLIAIPACKKKKPTEPDSTQNTGPIGPPGIPPGPGGQQSTRPPGAPTSPVFSSAAEAPMRAGSRNNLVQIGLAIHNFHDANNFFPSAYLDKTGKPGLSWRVAILPYIEQANLFRMFKLDEPWDSENNKKLIAMMPKTFAPPRTETNGYTFYRGFTGPGTWLPPLNGNQLPRLRMTNVPDGLSNTILVAEAADPVIWTKPDEMVFGQQQVPQLGGVFASGAFVLVADGSVQFLRKGFSPQKLSALIGISDGQISSFDD